MPPEPVLKDLVTDLERDLERLHRRLFSWCLVCCRGDRGEAEEVLQTVYLKVLDGRARHGGRGDIEPWLFAVCRKTAAGLGRRAAFLRLFQLPGAAAMVRPGGPGDGASGAAAPERASSAPSPEAEALRNEEVRRVRDALAGLSSRQREVLELVFYQGLALQEAAFVMGLSVGAVRQHYHRGKERLRTSLGKGG